MIEEELEKKCLQWLNAAVKCARQGGFINPEGWARDMASDLIVSKVGEKCPDSGS